MEHHLFSAETGYFVAIDGDLDAILADMPEDAREVPPRPSPFHAWDGAAWVEQALALDDRRAAVVAKLATIRWERETSGIIVNGMPIPTDDKTQARVDQIVKAFQDGDITGSVSFKSVTDQGTAWIELSQVEMEAIKAAGAQHVQACFDREKALYAEVMAATSHDQLDAIDLTSGWPE